MPCVSLRGREGGDSKPRPKQCPITSPDRPGPLVFQRATLKNWVGPGYESKLSLSACNIERWEWPGDEANLN